MELEKQVEKNTERLDKHEKRINNVEKDNAVQNNKIDNLCASLDRLTTTIEEKLDKSKDYRWIIASILIPIIFFLCSKIF